MSVAAAQAGALRRRTLDLAGHNVLIAAPLPPASGGSSLVSSSAPSGPVSQSEDSAFVSTSSNLSASHSTAASISPISTSLTSDITSSAVPPATSASASSAVSSAAAQKSTSSAISTFETSTTTLPASHSASPTMSSAKSSAKVTSTFALSVTKVEAVTTTSAAPPTSSSDSSPTVSAHSTSTVPVTTSKTASKTSKSSVSSTSKTQIKVPTTATSSSLNPVTDKPSTSSTIPQVPTTSTPASPKSTTASAAPSNAPTTTATGGQGSVSSPGSSPSSVITNVFSSASSRAGIVTSTPSSSTHAESTLSKPVSVTLVSDGQTITTAPSLVTSLSTSTASDGSVATFSSVFANPTPVVVKSGIADNWDFFDDKGKVAGVFIAVGLAIIALIGAIFYCRRRTRRAAAIHGMMIPDNRFHRDMTEQHTTYHPGRLPGGFGAIPDDPQRYLMAPSIGSGGSHLGNSALERSGSMSSHRSHEAGQAGIGAISALGLSGIHKRTGSQTSPVDPLRYEGPFSDYQSRFMVPSGTAVGIAISGDPEPESRRTESAHQRPPSPAPSSPSVYPPSLPPVPEKDEKEVDDLFFYEQETQRRPIRPLPQAPQKAFVDDTKVQDPFASPLDDYYNASRTIERRRPPPAVPMKILTGQAYQPLTPPDSSQGHSPALTPITSDSPAESAKQPSPFANGFLGRPVKSEPMRPKRNPLRAANSLDRPSSSSSSGHA